MGFTVFADLTPPETALAILDALGPDLAPSHVKGMGHARPLAICGPGDWLSLWAVRGQMTVRGAKTEVAFGSDWSRRTAPQGYGMVNHGQQRGDIRSSTLILDHSYSARIDWLGVFTRLCTLLTPAYAMAHLFTPEQVETGRATGLTAAQTGQVFRVHKRPAEEYHATVKPPFFDCQLPQLAWANWFGPEWEGRADAVLQASGATGPLLTLSPRIEDVANAPTDFAAARSRLELLFPPGIVVPRPVER